MEPEACPRPDRLTPCSRAIALATSAELTGATATVTQVPLTLPPSFDQALAASVTAGDISGAAATLSRMEPVHLESASWLYPNHVPATTTTIAIAPPTTVAPFKLKFLRWRPDTRSIVRISRRECHIRSAETYWDWRLPI